MQVRHRTRTPPAPDRVQRHPADTLAATLRGPLPLRVPGLLARGNERGRRGIRGCRMPEPVARKDAGGAGAHIVGPPPGRAGPPPGLQVGVGETPRLAQIVGATPAEDTRAVLEDPRVDAVLAFDA